MRRRRLAVGIGSRNARFWLRRCRLPLGARQGGRYPGGAVVRISVGTRGGGGRWGGRWGGRDQGRGGTRGGRDRGRDQGERGRGRGRGRREWGGRGGGDPLAREIEEEAANRVDRVIGFCEIGRQRSFGFLGKDGEVLIRGKTAFCQKGESGRLQRVSRSQ